jgi:hypothetical protein
MFGNFTATAGVVASNFVNSPNIIEPTINWNFNDVFILDFNPPGVENINDRPRINSWRDNDGIPDFRYLQYLSGGQIMLSPAPVGTLIQPWGNRKTGSYKLSKLSIGGNRLAGIDLFTHNFATPINLNPPIQEWSIDNSLASSGELKYQYLFKTGNKYPVIDIEIDYKNNCKPVTIPTCNPDTQLLSYIGTGALNGCPIFSCINKSVFTTSLEVGDAYDIDWIDGPGKALFGRWSFSSGFGTFRNTSNSNQFGRQSIGNDAFFIVGTTGSILSSHIANFDLTKQLNTGSSLSFDVNYAWYGGVREVIFRGYGGIIQEFGSPHPDAINNTRYRFFHGENDNLTFFTSGIAGVPTTTGTHLITGGLGAYLKAFNYRLTNLGTGMEMVVRSTGISEPLYINRITGLNIDWSNFVTGLTFTARTFPNVSPVDWFNYGLYFNNIKYETVPDPISQIFVTNLSSNSFKLSWNNINSATGYRLDISTDSNFTNYIAGYNNKTLNVNFELVQNVASSTNYYTRVRAVNELGQSVTSPVLNVKTISSDSIILTRNFPDIAIMGDVLGCQKLEIFNYVNTSNVNLEYSIIGDVDDELFINNVLYESGMYPFLGWPSRVCNCSFPINGAHSITPYNGTLAPGQSLKLETMSYDNPGGATLLRYNLQVIFYMQVIF